MTRFLILLLAALSVHFLAAQNFTRKIGGADHNDATAIDLAGDGGFYLGGGSGLGMFSTNWKMFLGKTDPMGLLQWSRTYGGPGHQYVNAIRGLGLEGVIAVGLTDSLSGHADALVVRSDAEGNVIWSRQLGVSGNDHANSVDVMQDGFIVSVIMHIGTDSTMTCLARFNADGDTLWVRRYPGLPFVPIQVRATDDGGSIVVGRYFGVQTYMMLLKVDADGEPQWCHGYGQGFGAAVEILPDGGYLLLGDHLFSYLEIVKVDAMGAVDQARRFTIPSGQVIYGKGLHLRSDGLTITGETSLGPAVENLYTMDLQLDGTLNWIRGMADEINIGLESSVANGPAGTVLFARRPDTSLVSFEMLLATIDANGNAACNGFDIAIGQQDIVVVATPHTAQAEPLQEPTFEPIILIVSEAEAVETPICIGTSTIEHDHAASIRVQPNPVSDMLQVLVPDVEGFGIGLMSATGQVVYSYRTFQGQRAEIPVEHLEPGVYLLRVLASDKWRAWVVVVE